MTATRALGLVLAVMLAGVAALLVVRASGEEFTPTSEQRVAFVESQARANCLVQRTVFPSREALQAAYDGVVLGAGLDAGLVRKLQDFENRDRAIRVAITDRVKQLCGS